MSTRMTLTTLRPSPSGSDCSIIVSETSVGGSSEPTPSVNRKTIAADHRGDEHPDDAAGHARCRLEAVRQAAQHEHEQHRGERLDGDLGQRQVGSALDDEQAGHRVADHAEEQGAGEAAADDRRGEGEGDQQGGDRHVGRQVDEVGPARPPRAAEQQRSRHDARR